MQTVVGYQAYRLDVAPLRLLETQDPRCWDQVMTGVHFEQN